MFISVAFFYFFCLLGLFPLSILSAPISSSGVEKTSNSIVSYKFALASGVNIHDLAALGPTNNTVPPSVDTFPYGKFDARDVYQPTIGIHCETTLASPQDADVKKAMAYFSQIGNDYCCQKGSDCAQMIRVGTAEVSVCAGQVTCFKCEMVRRAIGSLLDKCPPWSGKVGGKVGILDGRITIYVYHA